MKSRVLMTALTVAVLLGVVPTARGAAVSDIDQGPAGYPGHWSAATSVDPLAGKPLSISCVASGFCAVGDENHGVVLREKGHWQPVSRFGTAYRFDTVDCVSATFCAAIGGFLENAHASVYDGTGWSTPTPVDLSQATDLSCTSASFCVAVGRGLYSIYDGSGWSPASRVSSTFGLIDVSCVSSTFCLAAGTRGTVFQWDGQAWSQRDEVTHEAVAISCTSRTQCALFAGDGNVQTYDGTTWSAAEQLTSSGYQGDIECTGPEFCIVTATDDRAAFTYDGEGWTQVPDAPQGLWSVSCQAAGHCWVARPDGTVVEYRDGRLRRPVMIDRPSGYPVSVSCSTTTDCRAADIFGNVVHYVDGTWSRPNQVDPSGDITAISCPTSRFCVAVDASSTIVTLQHGVWSDPVEVRIGRLDSVSCPTTTFCAAVSETGKAVTFNGTTWGHPATIDAGEPQRSVSCPSATFCVSMSAEGVSTYDGTSWGAPYDGLHYAGDSVACSSPSFCLAVADRHDVIRWNGTAWVDAAPIAAGGVEGISCADDNHCTLVIQQGHAWRYDDGVWTHSQKVRRADRLVAVSCPNPDWCVALDDSTGDAYTYTNP